MADLFISYAREDRPVARRLAQALGDLGWSVWWDEDIRSGTPFDQRIEQKLQEARCVLVLWSRDSVGSQWVRAEASIGLRRGILISLRIDDVPDLPILFTNIQTLDLRDLRDLPNSPEFEILSRDIREILNTSPGGKPNTQYPMPPSPGPPARSFRPRSRLRRIVIAAVISMLGCLAAYFFGRSLAGGALAPMPTGRTTSTFTARVFDSATLRGISNASLSLSRSPEILRSANVEGVVEFALPSDVNFPAMVVKAPGYEEAEMSFGGKAGSVPQSLDVYMRAVRPAKPESKTTPKAQEPPAAPAAHAKRDGGPEFTDPRISGRTIDGCIISASFPDTRLLQCSHEAQQVIADLFCKTYGYAKGLKWETPDTHKFQESYKLHYDKDNDGVVSARWVEDNGGGCIFTYVLCGE